MNRVRWFEVNWNSKFDILVKDIINHEFNENEFYGFQVHKKRENYLHATYIKKKEIEEEVINPITNESILYNRIIYEKTSFILDNSKLGIEVINPNRNIREVINTLSSMTNFNISIKELNINLSELLKSIHEDFNSLVVRQINYYDITINNTTIKIEGKNDRDNLEKDLHLLLKDINYKIEKIKCSFKIENVSSSFELSNKGILKTHKENLEILIPIIKKHLVIN